MINTKQFDIYKKYYGDGDMFIRFGTRKETKIMDNFDWSSFHQMIQDIYLVYSNKTSEEYVGKVLEMLDEITIEQKLKDDIIEYSKKMNVIQQEYKDLLSKWL